MNKKITIILGVFLALISFGCSDWLEVLPPQDLVQDEFWKTQDDVESVLISAYKQCAIMDETWFMTGELRGDMVQAISDNSLLLIGNGKILPNNWLCKWNGYYEVIKYCNFILEFGDEAVKADDTFFDYELAAFESEAYFLRSFVYFHLVKMYENVPFVESAPKTDNQDFYLPVSSGDSILNVITDDLLKARLSVSDEYGDPEINKGRATRAAIDALLADIYLWKEDYENCIKHIDLIDPAKYLLMPGISWFDNFYPGNSLESIFEFQLGSEMGVTNTLYDQTYGNRVYLPSIKAYEIFLDEESLENLRAEGSITKLGGSIWKYCGSDDDNTSTRSGAEQKAANWKLYRVAGVQLMKAEALAQLGRYSEAFEIVNRIRIRGGQLAISDIPSSRKEAEDLILEERAIELAFEGQRWWDLVRMGRRNNYERKVDFIQIVIDGLPVSEQMILANRLLDPKGWYWPIHDDELDRNKNLEQNEFYAPYSEERN